MLEIAEEVLGRSLTVCPIVEVFAFIGLIRFGCKPAFYFLDYRLEFPVTEIAKLYLESLV
jgi:hypothetical protein